MGCGASNAYKQPASGEPSPLGDTGSHPVSSASGTGQDAVEVKWAHPSNQAGPADFQIAQQLSSTEVPCDVSLKSVSNSISPVSGPRPDPEDLGRRPDGTARGTIAQQLAGRDAPLDVSLKSVSSPPRAAPAQSAPGRNIAEQLAGQDVPLDVSLKSLSISKNSQGSAKNCRELSATTGKQLPLRILLIRHAAYKGSSGGAVPDPGLSLLGEQQAQRLSAWLEHELHDVSPDGVFVVSSPMRRCLATMRPVVERLGLPREYYICHGAAYDVACAGMEMPGSSQSDVDSEFPVSCIGFGASGWDYRGSSPKETEPEFLARVRRLVSWLEHEAFRFPASRRSWSGRGDKSPVLLLCMHEAVLDLIIRILVDHEAPLHHYDGKIRHPIKNSFITEVVRSEDGALSLVRENSSEHMRFAVPTLMV